MTRKLACCVVLMLTAGRISAQPAFDISAGWSAPYGGQGPFGRSGPVFDVGVAHAVTSRVALRAAAGFAAYRQVEVPDLQFYCDPGPCDPKDLPAIGQRGATVWHATGGIAASVLPRGTRWTLVTTGSFGLARVVPTGVTPTPPPPETRPMVAMGVHLGRRVAAVGEIFLGVSGRAVLGLDLSEPVTLPAGTVWSVPVAAGTRWWF